MESEETQTLRFQHLEARLALIEAVVTAVRRGPRVLEVVEGAENRDLARSALVVELGLNAAAVDQILAMRVADFTQSNKRELESELQRAVTEFNVARRNAGRPEI